MNCLRIKLHSHILSFSVVSEKSARLHNKVDELEGHLYAAEILENNGLPQTISGIRDTQDNADETVKLFTKLTRMAGRKYDT